MKRHLLNLNPNENHRNQETLKIMKMIHNTSEALKHFAFALAVIAPVIMGAGAGNTQAQIINVNYSGGANATMNGIASYDLIASGSASRPAPSPYSGSTWNDFGNGIVVNGFQLVDVGDAPRNAADILSFEFPGQLPTTIDQVNRTISVTVPFSTVVTALSPTYLVSPFATGTPDSGTPRNFTTPQTYTVVSGSGSVTNIYTVTVSKAPATPDKDILTFGPGATISGTNISWTVPYGTDLTNLTPSYTVSTFATGSPASGSSGNFSTQQTYTVTAEDNSTKVYTVTVLVTPASSAKNILTMDSGAIITGTNIVLQVPYGTDLTTLAPTYTVSTFATLDKFPP